MKRSPLEIKELLIDGLLMTDSFEDNEKTNDFQNEIEYVDSFGCEHNDSIYIFSQGNETILASSDDDLNPIIGTFAGEYDQNDMPENFKEMMQHYAKEIEDYQNNNIELEPVEASYKSSWKTIQPLLPYTFNQSSPYNFKLEDTLSTSSTYGKEVAVVTGCNNTAMAQIVAYWGNIGINGVKYRVGCKATTAHTSIKQSGDTIVQQYICPALPAISEFDYDNILEHYNSYYNESGVKVKPSITPNTAQKNAVSQLMKYIGFTCLSSYGKSGYGTGTYPADSLKYSPNFYFNTSKSLIYAYTQNKNYVDTNENFEKQVYNELINRRPIFFCGYKPKWDSTKQAYVANGGHAFNCDGYNAETDRYHFNWGWDGHYNGWFSMSALNSSSPNSTTITAGFNYNKLFIGNFYPKKFMEDILKADYNGDGKIDINDVLFFTNLIDTNNVIPAYDRNGDGYVDLKDVSEIVSQLDSNKTYELSINGNSLFNNCNENDANYEHKKININKTSKKIEIITRKKINNNVSQSSQTLSLPTISNSTNSIQSHINGKSSTIRNKFNTFINNKNSNIESNNAFVYIRNNRSKYVRSPLPNNNSGSNELFIDLGLSVKWATKNIGATNSEDTGDYYAWGEVETKTSYTWSTYKYYINSTTASTLGSSIAKNKNFDKAYLLNTSMCMPTEAQWQELINNCEWTKTTKNNKNVWQIKGKNGNIMYLPINGCISESSSISYVNYGYYWTSNYYASNSLQARTFRSTDTPGLFTMYRRTGAGIRAVSV